MINEKFFIGQPIDFKGICYVYPPTLGDIINNDKFFLYYQLLTRSQDDIIEELKDVKVDKLPTPFEQILISCMMNPQFESICKEAFSVFIKQPITILYDAQVILVGDLEQEIEAINSVEDLRLITGENFFEFQNIIRTSMGEKAEAKYNPNEPEKIRNMRMKHRKRERAAAKSHKGHSMLTSMTAICCMNFGLNPLNIGELSYVAFKRLIEMYQGKESYELDIEQLLAGADSKKVKPKYWIREYSDYIDVEV